MLVVSAISKAADFNAAYLSYTLLIGSLVAGSRWENLSKPGQNATSGFK